MLRILESQAPAKQTATDTINTLSSRLTTATLLEDRRAAILGLRSFAKQYPASVASGALRDLTAALRRDGEDSDTIKVVLETLLMLFDPDENSPEASEEITLWLADEFTMRQDNITALLDLLDTSEFYLRLYSLQIISHVTASRPQRAQEVVLAAPLGVSRIAAVLDDRREAVRNEALLLLTALTPSNAELQKVVAFENAFDRVFALIEAEGGLTHGSTTVQDCLSLLANLLTLNISNQSYFREIGCVAKVSKLLADVIKEEESKDGVSEWIRQQRDMNVWGLLRVIQLFLVQGSQGTNLSQVAFWQNKVLLRILQIAFHQNFGLNVRAKSLDVCGDIIRGNAGLQEQFGDLSVPLSKRASPATNGHTSPGPGKTPVGGRSQTATPALAEVTNVIEALLELTLEPASLSLFDVRLSASNCMKAFIEGHLGIRSHVLRRAIEGHKSGGDTIPNILTVLLEPSGMRSNSDPYQVWMASVLLLHILHEDSETKAMALKVSEGNADEGEEVVTFVQSITSNIVAGAQHVEDERALLGYLMLLCIWLFEDPDAVNDFLGEGSNLNGLAMAVKVSSPTMPLVAGLCCLLLGIIYEFSTKDSPVPRPSLQGLIYKNLSREVYIDRLTKLRESPFVRDFEVMSISGEGPLPDVYFDATFVNFMKDNFSRLLRAIDRDPNFEVAFVANGIQKGISRDLVDGLRAELEDTRRQLQSANSGLTQLRQKLEQEELEHRRTKDSTTVELTRIKQINDSLHRNHEEEMEQVQKDARKREDLLTRTHESTLAQLRRDHLTAVEDVTTRHTAEKKYFEQRMAGHERELKRVKDAGEDRALKSETSLEETTKKLFIMERDLKQAQEELKAAENRASKAETDLKANHDRELRQVQEDLNKSFTEKLKAVESKADKAETDLKAALVESSTIKDQHLQTVQSLKNEIEELRTQAGKAKEVQTELDDLLVVFADLEAKRASDKKRLKDLGEDVSEDEDDEGDEEEEDEDEEDS